MAIVNLRINGHEYQIACDDGQEEHLRVLADEIDDRIRSLTFRMKQKPAEGMSLLMAALTMADEISEHKKEIGRLGNSPAAAQDDGRLEEMESAMAVTLDEIASRIEKLAGHIELK